ncbi:TPA: C-type natriuretic protein [Klebsiella pneumoniae]|nr:C-type natriuretic protein [Klebsiella pneumoniae]HBW6523089.1 C-type natriuretic protein [Klebsiella pneumoniae]
MSNLTSFDWWIGLYFVASGVAVAFTVGQSLVKLLLLRFANRKRIDDTLWCLGSLLEQRYGELKEDEVLCIKAKRFTATIQRTQDDKSKLMKKGAKECMKI